MEGTVPPEDFPDYTKGPYGYCNMTEFGLPLHYCPENSSHGGGSGDCYQWCACQVSCASDAECPVPATGSSTPVCSSGSCVLPCGDDADCPEGMGCVDGQAECAWIQEGEDNLGCWLMENPDYCSQFTTKEDCQERVTSDPLQSVGCIWVRETIHSTASQTCEPAGETESCVPGTRDCSREGLSCPGGETWVHFRDIGAGTASLMITDRCLVPGWMGSGDAEPCSFGDISLPLLCDCGCES